jgi:hypothetical protein
MAAMADHDRSPDRPRPPRTADQRPAPSSSPVAARALALQRAAGNRATVRTLARWAAHPDKDKKGVMMTDEAADGYNRLNPPLSK